jgi:heat shock protein HslJ
MRILTLALALALIGCAPLADTAKPIGLDGTDWVLTAMSGSAPIADSKLTLKFAQGSASGSAGCNQYHSTYTASGSKLEFGMIAATKRACLASEMNRQEVAYLEALSKTAAYEISAERLVLRDGANNALLEFARER